jgi:hypothetical protein
MFKKIITQKNGDIYTIILCKKGLELFNKYNWKLNKTGKYIYLIRTVTVFKKRITIRFHRELLNCPDNKVVDHINHNTLDNRICNLRICTDRENCRNRKKRSDNTSGYKGVYYRKDLKKYSAQIKLDNKRKTIGHFHCKHEAAKAYNDYAIKYYGEFAYLNIIKKD